MADLKVNEFISRNDFSLIKNHGYEILSNVIQKINFRRVEIIGGVRWLGITSIVTGDSDINILFRLQVKSSPKDCDFTPPEFILKVADGANKN